ncbi:MAG: putative porin [Candidatus Margulisbacteria bacterium]|nr:putative porin [Candidatus Margulisiibacteriota bacterium]
MNQKLLIVAMSVCIFFSVNGLNAEERVKDKKPGIHLKGDVRLRVQSDKKESTESRLRQRVRFRLGGKSHLSEDTVVKFGLATGGADPRSTNQTLENAFQSPDFRLDYVFVKHQLSDKWMLMGGKMKNPFWRPTDLLWDTDINPDGIGISFKQKSENMKWFIKAGYFILDELSTDTEDPFMIALQPGMFWKLTEQSKAKVALSYYLSVNAKGKVIDSTVSQGNNSLTGGGLSDDFSSLVLSSEIAFRDQFGLDMIKPFGEVVINTNQSNGNKGYIAGIAFGDRKVNDYGKWQTTFSYRYLGADAFLDILPDADAYGGRTDVEGYEIAFKCGISKSTTFVIDYYNMNRIFGTKDNESLIQFDLMFRFKSIS